MEDDSVAHILVTVRKHNVFHCYSHCVPDNFIASPDEIDGKISLGRYLLQLKK